MGLLGTLGRARRFALVTSSLPDEQPRRMRTRLETSVTQAVGHGGRDHVFADDVSRAYAAAPARPEALEVDEMPVFFAELK